MGLFDDMEIGNLLFGHSRGAYKFPDREIVDSTEWRALLNVLGVDLTGRTLETHPYHNERGGYEDDQILINPYYWGDDPEEAAKPNYRDKSIGFEIRWYKYPFRDAYMNWHMSAEELKRYFGSVALSYMAED